MSHYIYTALIAFVAGCVSGAVYWNRVKAKAAAELALLQSKAETEIKKL